MPKGFSMKIDWRLIKPFNEEFSSSTYAMNTPSGCVLRIHNTPNSAPSYTFIPDVNVAYNEETETNEFVCIIPMREEIRTQMIGQVVGCVENLIERYLENLTIGSKPNTIKS